MFLWIQQDQLRSTICNSITNYIFSLFKALYLLLFPGALNEVSRVSLVSRNKGLRWHYPVILWGYHPTFKLSGIPPPPFTLIVSPTYSMDRNSAVRCRHFFVKISPLHIVRISALRWTEFHQNSPSHEKSIFLKIRIVSFPSMFFRATIPRFWISWSLKNCDIIFYKPKLVLWEFSIVSSLSWYSILVQHVCNDRAWLTSECSPRNNNFGTVRQAIAWYIEV